jgi:hypothetical protein
MRFSFTTSLAVLAVSALLFQGCNQDGSSGSSESESPESWQKHLKPVDAKTLASFTKHARAYVPVYSHIYTEDRERVLNLAETLSVRNTDEANAIVISSVRYQSNTGKLIREYVPKPVLLDPMATADFVVRLDDTSGGSGASFVVEWHGEKEVNPPLIEAIMISTGSGRNLSFVCRAVDLPPVKPGEKKAPAISAPPATSAPATASSPAATSAPPAEK